MTNIDIDPLETVTTKKAVSVVTSKNDKAVTFDNSEHVEKVKTDNVVRFEKTDITDLANRFNLDLAVNKAMRMDRVAVNLSNSAQYMLAAGIDLLQLKDECQHGEYTEMLNERGIEERTARRAVQYTEFILSLPVVERNKMLTLPKSHVLALASADPEVVQDLLDSDDKELAALSVRQLRETIKSLDRKKTDMTTQMEAMELENQRLTALVKELRENRVKTAGNVPIIVQDFRLEAAALHKQAELALNGLAELCRQFDVNEELDGEWSPAVRRHLVGALMSLYGQISGALATYSAEDGEFSALSSVLDLMGEEEIVRCAQEYKTLTEEHRHEEALRSWEREMSRPQGKGRPKAKPVKGQE